MPDHVKDPLDQAVTLQAPAKMTLSLRVTGVRPDGYHTLDAEMVSLSLADRLVLGPGEGLTIEGEGASAGDDSVKWVGVTSDNLVTRALALVGRTASVQLTKHIPAGAGLGGGSADAAAILRWAGWTDLGAAARLGADVPFCVVGGRARVRGIGELVERLPFRALDLTLLTPPLGASTPAVYARWDALGGPSGDNGNDLEPAALAEVPELAKWRHRLGDASGQVPRLAGSGSTWFVEGHHPGPGHRLVSTVPAAP
ncbi:MAG: 4-(cytidine 5'-diphospho)-2-C-methyl-D-erythritol kinase [Candidatus Microthrix parvicella]|uniref:4-diphosphocytidyl-2-C-methyl-D-erythritol kinase n=1 Tax=Candidatus Neomicrothrix parvicella RN1 TaxID=1229780 RepID=R4YXT1_9ACTN|nr:MULTISPECIES: 4-diphosphocytidyl-2C-methyl-D-erythritol kinase [Microthrix]MBK7021220.1 4-(cytidine 5'-diphospho)-2-C-methyl-D-erythritol kinase [Candidatus Microthrix sp.]MBL0206277.1 4-(cytidine 5'-diphospho)-2-C-methyl-D-erythritol kinase [Candidatus Microthrix sp.]MBP7993456.1 4-(cytidine 5'-diphospho)-2-C-methyl-D-erythritol kinase [Candidatus Microthrix sp.]MBP9622468.1 4-(cytidine 5'-diphospho)-2-C-methyl-D-erythritol kinase [Candidatus Microthrix sp.]CCM63274.1 putative 4-diphosphoc